MEIMDTKIKATFWVVIVDCDNNLNNNIYSESDMNIYEIKGTKTCTKKKWSEYV